MRRVNLLPREDRRQGLAGVPQELLGAFAIVGAAIIFVIAASSLFFLFRLNSIDNTIADLDSEIAAQTERVQELQPYAQLESEIASKQPVADGIVRTRFWWDEFLRQLRFVVPNTTSLQSLTAEAAPVDIDASVGQQLQPPGAVTFVGFAEADYTNVADFILQMDTLSFLANSGLEQAELDRTTFQEQAISFEVSSEMVTIVGDRDSELQVESNDNSAAEAQYQDEENAVGADTVGLEP
ncbi:PilN domain-containing protein [Rubrobacter indicoceani]|uniref:PilN domain-containing protein n=1 Tax=Rubrobacter indicoceani TaxID=2051957 RepID=UPI000E5B3529|nr:PilN domain-containing protein [Rubrobacter indicoceani]